MERRSFIPGTHVGIDGDAVVSGVPKFLLGYFGRGVGGQEERVGAGAGLGQRVLDLAAVGANVHRSRQPTTTGHKAQEARSILVRESEKKCQLQFLGIPEQYKRTERFHTYPGLRQIKTLVSAYFHPQPSLFLPMYASVTIV